jgi:hypothetical protein
MLILVLSNSHFFFKLSILVFKKGFFQGFPSVIYSYIFKGSTNNKVKMCNEGKRHTNPCPNTTIHSRKILQGFKGYVEIIVRNILELNLL